MVPRDGRRPAWALAALAAVACAGITKTSCLQNGLGLTPPMGWDSWNSYGDAVTEKDIKEAASFIINMSLKDSGYKVIIVDDGWPLKERTANGTELVADPAKFPSGMKALGDWLHSKGLLFGLFANSGKRTCAGYAASEGFEDKDAALFASWGVDYIKYDNCDTVNHFGSMTVEARFSKMRDALNKTGRPIFLSVDDWGVSNTWEYGQGVANAWRTSNSLTYEDAATWDNILKNLDNSAGLSRFAGPGGWNNADVLMIGEPGSETLKIQEQAAHFALWALLKTPLILSANPRMISRTAQSIVQAPEMIAAAQDPLGVPGDLVFKQGSNEVWATILEGGARMVVLFNRHKDDDPAYTNATLSVYWHHIGLPPSTKVVVRDIYDRKDLGVATGKFTAVVAHHYGMAVKLTPIEASPEDMEVIKAWRPWYCSIFTDTADKSWACKGPEFDLAKSAVLAFRRSGYAPVSHRAYIGLAVACGLLAAALVAMGIAWRVQHVRMARKLYKKLPEASDPLRPGRSDLSATAV